MIRLPSLCKGEASDVAISQLCLRWLAVFPAGKQSLARLAAHMCGYAVETVVISGSYSLANFAEDLQRMCRRAGVKVGKKQGHTGSAGNLACAPMQV